MAIVKFWVAAVALVAAMGTAAAGNSETCSHALSADDVAHGVGAVFDSQCRLDEASVDVSSLLLDRSGCFSSTCRFCRTRWTQRSKHFAPCEAHITTATTTTSVARVLAEQSATTDCAAGLSTGDVASGISAVADASCPAGGVGCWSNRQCRYCRTKTTGKSAHLPTCESLTDCAAVAAKSGLAAVSFVVQPACNTPNPKMYGCQASTMCQLCRETKTDANQQLMSCSVLRSQQLLQQSDATTTTAAAKSSTSSDKNSKTTFAATRGAATDDDEDGTGSGATLAVGIVGAVAAVAIAVVASVFVVHHRRRREQESVFDTPREGSLVLVQSLTNISTI